MTAYELLTRNLEDIQVLLKDHGYLLDYLREGGDGPMRSPCVSSCPSPPSCLLTGAERREKE